MAVFTTADRDAVKSALITAAVAGTASVKVGVEEAKSYTLTELQALLQMILQDLASTATPSTSLRRQQIEMRYR